MADSDNKKYWFIKLPVEFFNRHDIKILESMPNGKDYCLFYLKLLLESVTHNGELRFNETIPYDENMLSIVTNTNVDVVRNAMKSLYSLGLVEMWDDKTIYMTEVNKMLGFETGSALRKREYRNKQKGDNVPHLSQDCPKDVPHLSQRCPQEIDIDIDKDIEIELDLEKELEKDLELEKELKQEQESIQEKVAEKEIQEDDITLSEVIEFIRDNHLNLKPSFCLHLIIDKEIRNWKEYLLRLDNQYCK